MKFNDPVDKIMSHNVTCLDIDDDLESAFDIMKRNGIRHLPVLKNGDIVGMLSMTDIKWLDPEKNPEAVREEIKAMLEKLSVAQVMTAHPYDVSCTTPIREVASLFSKEAFHALPVVDGDNLSGIVTTTDVMSYFLEHGE